MENSCLIAVVTTARMGSCWCGDCYCRIFADGSIQYTGNESWQKSERHNPEWVKAKRFAKSHVEIVDNYPNKEIVKVWRSYNSNLRFESYKNEIEAVLNNPAAFMGSDDDWEALKLAKEKCEIIEREL